MTMDGKSLKGVLEALIFASETPVSLDQMCAVLELPRPEIETALEELGRDCGGSGRGLHLEHVAGGYRFYTRPEHAVWIKRLIRTRQERRFSIPALETLAIVAYRQPITKAEIEMVRGVNSDGVLETLLERGLVKTRGRREGLGRPVLYGTTPKFLEYFGLSGLGDLPEWKEGAKDGSSETDDARKDPAPEPVQQASQPH